MEKRVDMIVEDLFLIISLDLDVIRVDGEVKCRVDFLDKKNGNSTALSPSSIPLFYQREPQTQLL